MASSIWPKTPAPFVRTVLSGHSALGLIVGGLAYLLSLTGVLERSGKLDARRALAQGRIDALSVQREAQRLDLGVMVTHHYPLDDIVAAYELFSNQRDGVLKVAIKPARV